MLPWLLSLRKALFYTGVCFISHTYTKTLQVEYLPHERFSAKMGCTTPIQDLTCAQAVVGFPTELKLVRKAGVVHETLRNDHFWL